MRKFARMNVEDVTKYCQSLPLVTTEVQWENSPLFKVAGKIFCFTRQKEDFIYLTLKCAPDEILGLRRRFQAVGPGFHMNKKYWNSVTLDGSISDNMLRLWINNSYRLVVAQFSPERRLELGL